MSYSVQCCKKLKEECSGEIISIMDTPFTSKSRHPSVWVLSDGGHGGFFKIDYCPFCGKKIEIIEE